MDSNSRVLALSLITASNQCVGQIIAPLFFRRGYNLSVFYSECDIITGGKL